jgi:NAD(P)H dehydrogenase (quinone)
MQHGMIWVGLGEMPMQPSRLNRLGSFSGAMSQADAQESPDAEPNAADKMTGEALGKRVAQLALKLKK